MKKMLSGYILIFLLLLNISGCAALFIGAAAGGVGMYAASKDTIQGDTDTPYEALWDAAVNVGRIRGTITQQDATKGYINIDSKPNRIWIRFERLTQTATRIRVSARKYKLPNIDLAQDVFVKMVEEAKRTQ